MVGLFDHEAPSFSQANAHEVVGQSEAIIRETKRERILDKQNLE
jgi:hypothetical protein